jgi:hypothetical protein
MAMMLCEMCGVTLEAENKEHLLRVYDRHVHEEHQSSPAQWTEAHSRIEVGKERAKQAAKKDPAPSAASR